MRETTSLDRLASGVFVGRIQEMMQLREGLKGPGRGAGDCSSSAASRAAARRGSPKS